MTYVCVCLALVAGRTRATAASAHTRSAPQLMAQAAVSGYTAAFAWAAVLFAVGAVIAATLFEHGTAALEIDPESVAAMAH